MCVAFRREEDEDDRTVLQAIEGNHVLGSSEDDAEHLQRVVARSRAVERQVKQETMWMASKPLTWTCAQKKPWIVFREELSQKDTDTFDVFGAAGTLVESRCVRAYVTTCVHALC